MDLIVREALPEDLPWIERVVAANFGSSRVVTRGRLFESRDLMNLVATLADSRVGVVGLSVEDGELEVVLLVAVLPRRGVGRRLLDEARRKAVSLGCSRLWLVTTNDNDPAMRFYESCGLRLARVYKDAVAESRKLKPEIPERGIGGVPIRDELEFELVL